MQGGYAMTKADKKSFGKRLNTIRKEQKVSSNALSEKCSVEPSYIRMIESGTRTPSMGLFIQLCNALNASPGYLLSDSLDAGADDQYDALCNRLREFTPKQIEMITAMIEAMMDKLEP
jgi:transcriptional regulator with XRE-family HTH domain